MYQYVREQNEEKLVRIRRCVSRRWPPPMPAAGLGCLTLGNRCYLRTITLFTWRSPAPIPDPTRQWINKNLCSGIKSTRITCH